MTERQPPIGHAAAGSRERHPDSSNVARPSSAQGHTGPLAVPGEPEGPIGTPDVTTADTELAIAHESGVEPKARSQWAYARMRFFRHRLAVASLAVLILIGLVALFAPQLAPYGYDEIPLRSPQLIENPNLVPEASPPPPRGLAPLRHRPARSRLAEPRHVRDSDSLWVALFVALLSTVLGTTVGAVAGYYGGQGQRADALHRPDPHAPGPGRLAHRGRFLRPLSGSAIKIGVILALLFWTAIARIVRGLFLSLREKEFVEAAKAAARATCGSSCGTCSRTRWGRSSST